MARCCQSTISRTSKSRAADFEERRCSHLFALLLSGPWTLPRLQTVPASSSKRIPPRHGSAEERQLACWRAVERGTNSKFPIGTQPCSRVCENVSENPPWATPTMVMLRRKKCDTILWPPLTSKTMLQTVRSLRTVEEPLTGKIDA
jgi:hypothetical protein